MPQNIYDDPDFFQGYSQLPRSRAGLAEAPEWPTLCSMLPSLQGARVLDLGCGFGAFARWAREAGAQQVLAIDLSEKMLERARALTRDAGIVYRQGDLEALSLAESGFDLVYSSLAFHYLPDFRQLAAVMHAALRQGGRLVFSVEHPVFTAPSHPAWQPGPDGRTVWALNDYLAEGARTTHWLAPSVLKYHRSVASYLNALTEQGFHLLRMEEWAPDAQQIAAHPDWADEVQRPPFLLVAAQA